MNKLITVTTLGLMLSASPIAMASSNAEIEALQAQVRQLTATLQKMNSKIDNLSAGQAENKKAVEKKSKLASWTERTKIKGDLRYRYENTNIDRDDARFGVFSKVNDQVDIGIQLATGGPDNATSTNETLDASFGTKDINLDLAYFNWHASKNLDVLGGKVKNPFFRPGKSYLIWDGDVRPEGLAIKFENDAFFVNGGAFYLDEQSDDNAGETYLFAGQAGGKLKLGNAKAKLGLSYYHYEGIEDNNVDGLVTGNNTTVNNRFENDFEILEAFGEVKTKVSGLPFTVFADYAVNIAANDDRANNGDNDTAWMLGFKLGKAKARGSWEVGYRYQDIEKDAVVSDLNDGDFASGNTDSKGHAYNVAYAIDKNWKFGLTYFDTTFNVDQGVETDSDILQADIKFKF